MAGHLGVAAQGSCDVVTGVRDMITKGSEMHELYTSFDTLCKSWSSADGDTETPFDCLLTEPFLLSAERDLLVKELRSLDFFRKFKFDGKYRAWVSVEDAN